MGEISLRRGQPGAAVDIAMLGLSHNPNNKALLLLKARSEAVRSPILAVPTLKLLCELDPNDIDVTIRLSNTYVLIGEYQKAIDLLKKKINNGNLSTMNQRRCMTSLASAMYKNGSKEEAFKEIDSLIESEPNDPGPFMAQIQLLKEDFLWGQIKSKTIEWYQSHDGKDKVPVVIARDLVAVDDNRARQVAEEVLLYVLSKDENNTEVLGVLAILMEVMGRSDESIEYYTNILKLEPNNLIALNNLAWLLCEKKEQYQEALKLAEKGLKIAPNYTDLIDTRGIVYYRLGQIDKAIQDFNKCIKLYPNNMTSSVVTHFHLARALALNGEKSKAIESLNLTFELNNRIGGLSASDLAEAKDLYKQLTEEDS